MEKARPWCGQLSDRGQLKNRTEHTYTHCTSKWDDSTPPIRRCQFGAANSALEQFGAGPTRRRRFGAGTFWRSVSNGDIEIINEVHYTHARTHARTRLTALSPGLPGWAGTRKVIPIWILLKQETVSGSGISWAICKSAFRSRQMTTPAPHHSVFYRPDALPAAQPTASKHWGHNEVH